MNGHGAIEKRGDEETYDGQHREGAGPRGEDRAARGQDGEPSISGG